MIKIKHHIIYILWLLSINFSCYAENIRIDSLSKLLSKKDLSKSQELEAMSLLGYEYWTVDPAKSIHLGRNALQLAIDIDHQEQIAFNYRVIGVAFWALVTTSWL